MNSVRPLVIVTLTLMVVLAGCGGSPGAISGGLETRDSATGTNVTPTPPADTTSVESTNGTLEVHFINVGQGASTLIVTPENETILIDTGDWQEDGEDVIAYLEAHDIDQIDHLVTSHADADHIGGHAAVITHFETERGGIGAVYDPGIPASSATYERYLDAVEEHDVTLFEAREGDTLPVSGADVSVLGPPEPYLAGEERNENSLVLLLRYGDVGFLFTGDTEAEGEDHLVETYGDRLDVTVLPAGHHGSRSSTGEELLDVTTPRVSVISSGYDSQYGHPHEETLERLDERDIPTYWTATHGTVVMRTDGESVEILSQRDAPTVATDLRSGEAIDPGVDDAVAVRATIDGAVSGDGVTDESTPEESTATETESPVTGSGELAIVEIHEDAAGDDNENLNDEYVVFENTGGDELDLSGWTLADEAEHTYTVPDGFTLAPGERVTVFTGSGRDTDSELYWGAGSAIWNNGGDTVVVTEADGEIVLEEEYP